MGVRIDNMGIVVEDLDAAVEFFEVLGLELEGKGLIEGEWAGHVTGSADQRVEIAMMRTPDGSGGVVQYETAYRLCYLRGPEGLLIGLAEALG